jgi:superoxide dismutase, Fe-Mn family
MTYTIAPLFCRPRNQCATDHAQSISGAIPILALDMYEHAYHLEFGANQTASIAAFMRNTLWSAVEVRCLGGEK